MMDIERFTRQQIPVQLIDGFGPEPGEKAEPIAMGRQTIWGGAGKPPGRDVMQAAARAARSEMLDRMRSSKASQEGAGQSERGARSGGPAGPRNGAPGGAPQAPPRSRGPRPPSSRGPRPQGSTYRNDDAQPPRPNAHLGTHGGHSHSSPRNPGNGNGGGQPDPMRTSVDSMTERGRRGGGGYRQFGGNGGGGAGYGAGRGNGARGPGGPRGSFNR